MKAELIVDLTCIPCEAHPEGKLPKGTVQDHPEAFRLVRCGCAVPADAECEVAAGMTAEQLTKAQNGYPKVAAGLLPEDYPAWEAGYMRGYKPNGDWIPGPNADELDEYEWQERKRESPLVFPGDEGVDDE